MIVVTRGTGNPPKRGAPQNDLGRHLRRPLERLRRHTGASLAFAGRVVPGSSDEHAIELSYFDGDVVGPLRGARLDHGHGLGGRVLTNRRSTALHNYVESPLITHTYDAIIRAERLYSIVAAPIIVGRKQIGVLYAARRSHHDQLGDSLDIVTDEARALEQQLTVSEVLGGLRSDRDELELAAWRSRVQDSHAKLRGLADTVDDPSVRAQMLEIAAQLAGEAPHDEPAVRLTAREQDVLGLLGAGLTNPAIADRLGIGLHTVKGHVKSLLVKLDASSRFEAVVNARRVRLIP
ncbi:LuxR C-terminal-related transcriptional regulator [Gordonia sp. (in: high G+C Gram-positive bacteria)]|uniref:helix-turn-helix transcriptional regulator n=1 Tax=Gordonia sp. (in: high G+C Gram-positive bacteria) TaxID=84139 RepID=UPI0025C2AD8D|nr:LuxR C-terminal-related transcriptional regulator [Gordonia sp. (in: high G+C Gram-positive bacteria)]